jgi:signal transduction histidine kinase
MSLKSFAKNLWRSSFSSQLSRQLSLWVLLGIFGVEVAIFIPSAYRRKHEQLDSLAMASQSAVDALTMADWDPRTFASHLPQLKQQAPLLTGRLYQSNGQLVSEFGENSDRLTFRPAPHTKLHYDKPWRYDIGRSIQLQDGNYYLVLSYDATSVYQDLINFTWRVSGLVVLISLSVTGMMMGIIGRRLIRPILLLQADVRQAGMAIAQGKSDSTFFRSTAYKPQNELQEVIQAFFSSHQTVVETIALRQQSEADLRHTAQQLSTTLSDLKQAQAQLIHTEKMSSLGQLGAGFAHEVNNPINFISANLDYVDRYSQDLLQLVDAYQDERPREQIQGQILDMELEFLREDLPNLIQSMKNGAVRIRDLVAGFRNFVRLDESDLKPANIHEGLDNTLMLLTDRLAVNQYRSNISIDRQYGNVPDISCYPGQLNQVFFHILANAIEGIDRLAQMATRDYGIRIVTQMVGDRLQVEILDNGMGIESEIVLKVFDPFFTTKDVGAGTGLGLTNSYQIINDVHGGTLMIDSLPKEKTVVTIALPNLKPHRL